MAVPSPGYTAFLELLPNEDARIRDRVWDALFPDGTVSLRDPVDFEYRVSYFYYYCRPLSGFETLSPFLDHPPFDAPTLEFLSKSSPY